MELSIDDIAHRSFIFFFSTSGKEGAFLVDEFFEVLVACCLSTRCKRNAHVVVVDAALSSALDALELLCVLHGKGVVEDRAGGLQNAADPNCS